MEGILEFLLLQNANEALFAPRHRSSHLSVMHKNDHVLSEVGKQFHHAPPPFGRYLLLLLLLISNVTNEEASLDFFVPRYVVTRLTWTNQILVACMHCSSRRDARGALFSTSRGPRRRNRPKAKSPSRRRKFPTGSNCWRNTWDRLCCDGRSDPTETVSAARLAMACNHCICTLNLSDT